MRITHQMKRETPIRYILALFLCASFSYAQTNSNTQFLEAVPPAGAVKGFIKAGDRCAALIVGGKTVYSNDVFTVMLQGRQSVWKVLAVTDKGARFAYLPEPERTLAPPPDETLSFGEFLMFLEDRARIYKDASTSVLKEQAVERIRDSARSWCMTNRSLCVKAVLSDIAMNDANSARLSLKNVEYGPFKTNPIPNLYVSPFFKIDVPLKRDQALGFKAGDTVVLSGQPNFCLNPHVTSFINGHMQRGVFTSFSILSDSREIGSLQLYEPKFEIFTPKTESPKSP